LEGKFIFLSLSISLYYIHIIECLLLSPIIELLTFRESLIHSKISWNKRFHFLRLLVNMWIQNLQVSRFHIAEIHSFFALEMLLDSLRVTDSQSVLLYPISVDLLCYWDTWDFLAIKWLCSWFKLLQETRCFYPNMFAISFHLESLFIRFFDLLLFV